MAPPKPKKKAPARKAAAPARKASAAPAKKRVAAQASRREKEARALRNRLIIGGVLIVLAGVTVFAAARPGSGPSTDELIRTGPGSCTTDRKADPDPATPQLNHVARPTYEVEPPSAGPHTPGAANPGFYTPESNVPSDGELVHALEHGFIVLWYRPDVYAAKRAQLETLSDSLGRELLFVPRDGLPGEVAVTGWKRRMLCAEFVPEQVTRFTRAYVDQGPEKGFL